MKFTNISRMGEISAVRILLLNVQLQVYDFLLYTFLKREA
jgi:hypothetical protein